MPPKNILDLTNPGPESSPDVTASGVISTQNLVPAGVATANSAVEINVENKTVLSVQTIGTYTGALSVQITEDGDTWVTLGGSSIINATTGVGAATIPSGVQSIYKIDVSAAKKARVTALAAVTGSVTVLEKASSSDSLVTLAGPLPAGSATIGTVLLGTGTSGPGKAEDAVAATGDVGIFNLIVRRDAPTISTSAAGDYSEMAGGPHGQLYVQTIDAVKRTYSAGFKVTPVAGTVLEIFGAAATTVEINRITLTLFGTAAGKIDVAVNKRSAVATGGTAITAPAKVPYNSADAAAASTVKGYSAAPTAGTLVGLLRQAMLANGASIPSDRLKLESGQYSKSFTLTSATQAVTVDLAGTMPTGAELAVDIEWTEY